MSNYAKGRRPSPADLRDYSPDHPEVKSKLVMANIPPENVQIKDLVDLRHWCSPVKNQLSLGSCTSHAGAEMVEFFENRVFGKFLQTSPLFLYKMTRLKGGFPGDNGADLRSTMGALALYGLPPETSWPYTDDPKKFDLMPGWEVGSEAANYQALQYIRLDATAPGSHTLYRRHTLDRICRFLNADLPCILGFTCYSSIDHDQVQKTGQVPFPGPREKMEGGHAIFICGYDYNKVIQNPLNGPTTKGALLFQNSWSTDWGEQGFGWLPFEYILQGLADDVWTLLLNEWLDQSGFGFN
jgi:C1A family cysteine protease